MINTLPDPDTYPRGQLPNPNECNSILMSRTKGEMGETRGETLTRNSNECHSTLTSVTRDIYPLPLYRYIDCLRIEYDC